MFSVADVHRGLVSGLTANGVQVWDFPYDDLLELYNRSHVKVRHRWRPAFNADGVATLAAEHLKAAIWQYWPDVIILTSCFWIPPLLYGVLRARPHHVVAWFTESPYEDDAQMNIAKMVDTVIINDPSNLEEYRKVNPRTYYLPQSYDPAIHHPGPGRPEWACDVGFVGTGFRSRIEFLERINWTGMDLRLGGMWKGLTDESPLRPSLVHPIGECFDNADAVDLYRSSRASFNIYRKEHTYDWDGWAMSPREVELAATGTFFVREPRPEGDEVLHVLPTFTEPEELERKLRWWLDRDTARERVANQAARAVADRTFQASTARLLKLIDGAPKAVWSGGVVSVSYNKE